MKATPNQILMAASNILSGLICVCKTFDEVSEHIEDAVRLAQRLADAVPNTEDIIDKPDDILNIIKRAYNKIGKYESPSSLLVETIRINENVNRAIATAYLQKAESLGFVIAEQRSGSKRVNYYLND